MSAGSDSRLSLRGARASRNGASRARAAVDGITCAACIGEIEGAACALPGVPDARLNYDQPAPRVEWRGRRLRSAGALRARSPDSAISRASVRAGAGRDRRSGAVAAACCAASRVAGFAAMNVMLLSVSVWAGECRDIDAGDARLVSLALGADRAAGGGLRRPAVLPERLRALARPPLNMDVPISLGVMLALAMSVVETPIHAEHAYFDCAIMLMYFLLLGRYLDAAMRRKTRSVAANLAAPARARSDAAFQTDGGRRSCRRGVGAGDHRPGAPRRTAAGRRRGRLRRFGDRREPHHRRNRAPHGRAGRPRLSPARSIIIGALTLERRGGGSRHAAR